MTALPPEQGAALLATLDRIIASHAFSTDRLPRRGDEIDAKETASRHAAARAALSHLEHVMKLAASGAAASTPGEMLATARAEIGETEEKPEADDACEPG